MDDAGLAAWLAGLDTGWAGLSLTMPLKRSVLPLLDDVTPLAAAVGAVNTVLVTPSGTGIRLAGDNTDVHGIVAGAGAREAPTGRPGRTCSAAGATACSAVAALGELGCAAPRS